MRKGRALESAKSSVVNRLVFASFQGACNGQRLLSDARDCYVIVVGLNVMKWHRAIPIFCVLILLSVATAGCTASLNPPYIQFNASPSTAGTPAGINAQGTTNGTAHMLAVEQLGQQ